MCKDAGLVTFAQSRNHSQSGRIKLSTSTWISTRAFDNQHR
jgi:hypothetical protein